MENKINIAELLKDCPQGMELDCTVFESLEFDGIVDNEYLPIRCRVKNPNGGYNVYTFTKYGCWLDATYAKCVIFPKGKTTWEGFQRPFNDGDVFATDLGSVFFLNTHLNTNECYGCYVGIGGDGSFHVCEPFAYKECCGLATEKEKQKLFDAIKANGYLWNAETKTLEKLVEPKFKVGDIIQDIDVYKVKITKVNAEDECYEYESMIAKGIDSIGFSKQDEWELAPNKFDINTLKPFESRVLTRDNGYSIWLPNVWGLYDKKHICSYVTIGNRYKYCIPYEGNEHLLGTTNDCDEYYKNWD